MLAARSQNLRLKISFVCAQKAESLKQGKIVLRVTGVVCGLVTSTGVNCKLQFPGLPSTAGTKRHREARLLKAEAPVSIDWFIFV